MILALGDHVSTDALDPGRFMATVLPGETPQYLLADDERFQENLNAGCVEPGCPIVAGWNFGCGSSSEQAASALKGYGLTVVARSFARSFLRNAVNLGLKTIICPDTVASVGGTW